MNSLHDLQQATGGAILARAGAVRHAAATSLGRVVIDSRQIEAGDLFWAIVGPNHDGADFAAEAFARGAAGAVAARPVEAPADRWVLTVDDTRKALHRWAAWRRQQFTGTVIGVTGSVGKTTARQMIHCVLKTRLAGTASPRNYNNHLGLPLSVLAIEPEHDYAVLELGASARGEIAELAALCAPHLGVITNVGDAHLGGFGSRRGIAEAKGELLAALPPDGHAVLGNDPWLRRVAGGCKVPVTWVGCDADCDLVAGDVRSGGGKLSFRVADCEFCVPVWGRHHLRSALVAVAVGRLMGFTLEESARALENFDPVPMRCEVIEIRGATIINDTYNASPTAMRAALELVRDFDALGRRIIVCGDMAELGDESAVLHRRLGGQIVTLCDAHMLIACGQFARQVTSGARAAGMPRSRSIACRTAEETLPYLGQMILPGDVVLVKGARVMGMERVVEAMQRYPLRRSA